MDLFNQAEEINITGYIPLTYKFIPQLGYQIRKCIYKYKYSSDKFGCFLLNNEGGVEKEEFFSNKIFKNLDEIIKFVGNNPYRII